MTQKLTSERFLQMVAKSGIVAIAVANDAAVFVANMADGDAAFTTANALEAANRGKATTTFLGKFSTLRK